MNTSKFILAFGLLLLGTSASAQLKIGLSSSYSITSTGEQDAPVSLSNQRYSDQIQYLGQDNSASYGLATFASFEKLFFRGDVKYTTIDRKYAISSMIGTEGEVFTQSNILSERNHFISIPIAAGLQYKDLQVGVGPIFNFRIDSDDNLTSNSNLSHSSRGLSTSFQLFLGYKVNKQFHINASIERSLSNLGNEFIYNNKGINLNIQPTTIQLGVAYFL